MPAVSVNQPSTRNECVIEIWVPETETLWPATDTVIRER